MISAIIIETPLVDFYYSFKHHNNIMFVEITEKLLYTEHIFTKLYYCMTNLLLKLIGLIFINYH